MLIAFGSEMVVLNFISKSSIDINNIATNLLGSSSNRRLDSCRRVAVFARDMSACMVRDKGRELLVLTLCMSALLDLVSVSVESKLIPLSV